eukprot:563842-Pelagomonas_calceolata.AAC.2
MSQHRHQAPSVSGTHPFAALSSCNANNFLRHVLGCRSTDTKHQATPTEHQAQGPSIPCRDPTCQQ